MDRAAAEVLQSSPHVQQQMMIMTGNPNYSWWNNSSMRSSIPPILTQELSASPNNFFLAPPNLSPYTPSSSSSSSSSNSSSSSSSSSSNSSLPMSSWFDNHELPPDSWSQLLLGGLVGEEERSTSGMRELFQGKKLENWEEELISQLAPNDSHHVINDHVKQEHYSSRNSYISYNGSHAGGDNDQADFPAAGKLATLSHQVNMSAANSLSPRSCLTNFSNVLDFTNKLDAKHPTPDRSSECNSTATGGAIKKARVQPSSTQRTFKVRKEKLGDRITALHQLVSPFGKTDTASVLLEAIGYIRFLHSQIEALSLPYLGIVRGTDFTHQRSVQGDKKCIFPEDPGQLLNDNCMKIRKGPSDHPGICHEEPKKDLRSRGLCLVPVSCPMQVGNDNGADYWAPPSLGGSGLGGFR